MYYIDFIGNKEVIEGLNVGLEGNSQPLIWPHGFMLPFTRGNHNTLSNKWANLGHLNTTTGQIGSLTHSH